ncbi:MAG TPA: hypothetical protein VJP79_00940 [Nitrososphaera sp.]|nr:hypothetical protein [Nitrososphaera sp.]
MITLKIGAFIIGAFVAGAFIMSPVPQAIAAVIATDVQCTGCVGTSDVAGNAITAAKIKDGEVKAAEIATDAVGAAELQGVTKLIFAQCRADSAEATKVVNAGQQTTVSCSISGVDFDDSAIVTMNTGVVCFDIMKAAVSTSGVLLHLENECPTSASLGQADFGILVYDK